jgi:hypothetical protein
MQAPYWQFASTGGGAEDGVNNPELEYFEGDYNYYLAREILQNALDARLDTSKPVEVEFSLIEMSKYEFPGFDEYVDVWKSAKAHWPESDEKCHRFIDAGLKCLDQPKLRVLKISDYNTRGLNGEDGDRSGAWFNLVKSVGSTNKTAGQGGSFGIGKGAPFAASTLRTCFYSTFNDRSQTVFQGVAKLVSHAGPDGKVRRGEGSYGMAQQASIRNRSQIEEAMVRKQRGLDIYVMGYKVQDDWQEKLTLSVLRNFWLAILDAELTVRIDGQEISQATVDELLVKHFKNEPYADSIKPQGNPLEYFKAYKNSKPFHKELPLLGSVRFYFNLTEEHINRVVMLRKHKMVIYARQFRFPAHYAGVFICDNDKGNEELRRLETPSHDNWDSARYPEKGQTIEDEIRTFIQECLKKMTKAQEAGRIEIPGLHRYLPFEHEEDDTQSGGSAKVYSGRETAGKDETSRELGAVEGINETVTISPYHVKVINERKAGFDGEDENLPRTQKAKRKPKPHRGGEGEAETLLKENLQTRVFCIGRSEGAMNYRIVLRSGIDGRCNLKVTAVGEEGTEKVALYGQAIDAEANQYQTSGNRIMNIPISSTADLRLDFEVEGAMRLALNIDGYALQQ